jgi:hypothetical protein
LADWLITAHDNLDWNVRLEDCDWAHAKSVLENLEEDPVCPDELELDELPKKK